MNGEDAAKMIANERHFLQNVLKDFKAEDGDFKPFDGMWTVAQQIKHIAHTIGWFREGVWGSGFDMDFEKMGKEMAEPITFDEATKMLNEAYDGWGEFLKGLSEADLAEPIPKSDILSGPRSNVIIGNAEHTAHHRGILTVYLRGLGRTPTMVYG